MSVPEVVCPICRATTTESETMENYFILDHDEDRDEGNDDDLQVNSDRKYICVKNYNIQNHVGKLIVVYETNLRFLN